MNSNGTLQRPAMDNSTRRCSPPEPQPSRCSYCVSPHSCAQHTKAVITAFRPRAAKHPGMRIHDPRFWRDRAEAEAAARQEEEGTESEGSEEESDSDEDTEMGEDSECDEESEAEEDEEIGEAIESIEAEIQQIVHPEPFGQFLGVDSKTSQLTGPFPSSNEYAQEWSLNSLTLPPIRAPSSMDRGPLPGIAHIHSKSFILPPIRAPSSMNRGPLPGISYVLAESLETLNQRRPGP